MASRFSLAPVIEPPATQAADAVGALLAAHRDWIAPFLILLNGLDFNRPPSMTIGATAFELGTGRHAEGARLLSAMDDVYAEVRDGYDASHIHGELLERYVYHSLEKQFPLRIAACEILKDDIPIADFKLDAATSVECPAVAVEAKTSERALVGRKPDQRAHHRAKTEWVIGLLEHTDGTVLCVFATWAPEERFRATLKSMLGKDKAQQAFVMGHELVADLPNRVKALVGRLTVPEPDVTAST